MFGMNCLLYRNSHWQKCERLKIGSKIEKKTRTFIHSNIYSKWRLADVQQKRFVNELWPPLVCLTLHESTLVIHARLCTYNFRNIWQSSHQNSCIISFFGQNKWFCMVVRNEEKKTEMHYVYLLFIHFIFKNIMMIIIMMMARTKRSKWHHFE